MFVPLQAANKSHRFYRGTELEKFPVNDKNDEQVDVKLNWSDFSKYLYTCKLLPD